MMCIYIVNALFKKKVDGNEPIGFGGKKRSQVIFLIFPSGK